jgi:dTDP-4-dehydrorhamnose reductase
MAEGLTGVFHLTNAGSCSWYEFTREILRQAGFGATPVAPITSHELNRPARRPAYSVLANTAWQAAGHPPLRLWSDALAAMLKAWQAAGPSAEPRFPQSPK